MSCHYNLLFLKASIYNAVSSSSSAPQLLMINRPTTRSKVSSGGGTIPSEVDIIYVPSVSSKYIKYDNL